MSHIPYLIYRNSYPWGIRDELRFLNYVNVANTFGEYPLMLSTLQVL